MEWGVRFVSMGLLFWAVGLVILCGLPFAADNADAREVGLALLILSCLAMAILLPLGMLLLASMPVELPPLAMDKRRRRAVVMSCLAPFTCAGLCVSALMMSGMEFPIAMYFTSSWSEYATLFAFAIGVVMLPPHVAAWVGYVGALARRAGDERLRHLGQQWWVWHGIVALILAPWALMGLMCGGLLFLGGSLLLDELETRAPWWSAALSMSLALFHFVAFACCTAILRRLRSQIRAARRVAPETIQLPERWMVHGWREPRMFGLGIRLRSGRADRDECASCAYDLGGLAQHLPCPECSTPGALARARPVVLAQDPGVLRRMRTGLRLAGWAWCLIAAVSLMRSVLNRWFWASDWLWVSFAFHIASLVLTIAAAMGIWRMATGPGDGRGLVPKWLRSASRLAACATVPALTLGWAMEVFGIGAAAAAFRIPMVVLYLLWMVALWIAIPLLMREISRAVESRPLFRAASWLLVVAVAWTATMQCVPLAVAGLGVRASMYWLWTIWEIAIWGGAIIEAWAGIVLLSLSRHFTRRIAEAEARRAEARNATALIA